MSNPSQVRHHFRSYLEHLRFLHARGQQPLYSAFVMADGTISALPQRPPSADDLMQLPHDADHLINEILTTADTIRGEHPSLAPVVETLTAYAPKDTACARDILEMLKTVASRMTTGQILLWMQEHGKTHSESNIVKTLNYLCQKSHQIDNRENNHGRGYGIPEAKVDEQKK